MPLESLSAKEEREPIHPWRWRALALWIILFTVLVIWAIVQSRNSVHGISKNRKETFYNNCKTQNERHDATIAELHQLVQKISSLKSTTPIKKTQLQGSVVFTTLLVDALAPKQNCKIVVPLQLKGKKVPIPLPKIPKNLGTFKQ